MSESTRSNQQATRKQGAATSKNQQKPATPAEAGQLTQREIDRRAARDAKRRKAIAAKRAARIAAEQAAADEAKRDFLKREREQRQKDAAFAAHVKATAEAARVAMEERQRAASAARAAEEDERDRNAAEAARIARESAPGPVPVAQPVRVILHEEPTIFDAFGEAAGVVPLVGSFFWVLANAAQVYDLVGYVPAAEPLTWLACVFLFRISCKLNKGR